MKIGVCFSGQLRAGVWAMPAIKSFIGDLWKDCDFFVHTWESQYNKNYSSKVINDLNNLMSININYKNPNCPIWTPIGAKDLNRFLTSYNPKLFLIEDYKTTASSIEESRRNFITQNNIPKGPEYFPTWMYYSYYRSVEMLRQYEQQHGVTYDIIVKLRPDVIFPMNDGSPVYRYRRAELKKDIENVLANPNKLYRKQDVYWISTGENIKKSNLFWEKSLKTIDVSFWSYAADIGIEVEYSKNGHLTFLRNLWRHVPVDDFFMLDTFERFFTELPPKFDYINNPASNVLEQTTEKLKLYIQNYGIIKELCDETNCTIN